MNHLLFFYYNFLETFLKYFVIFMKYHSWFLNLILLGYLHISFHGWELFKDIYHR